MVIENLLREDSLFPIIGQVEERGCSKYNLKFYESGGDGLVIVGIGGGCGILNLGAWGGRGLLLAEGGGDRPDGNASLGGGDAGL